MAIRLYDTLTRTIKPLQAGDSERFRFYCCGPTVYGRAHIGNFRSFILADVLYRILRIDGMNPLYARNLTDVDDRTIKRSLKEGVPLRDFTAKWTAVFHQDCALLNILPPDVEPRATEHIKEQIALIEKLMEKGHAYKGRDGSVYFRIGSFKPYGKLSRLEKRELRTQTTSSSGRAKLADHYDRDAVGDFALWKARKKEDGDNFWASPWGEGRPGWHLECSAMSMAYLGESFDLHAGGGDLCFPHHENEIAQSEASTGKPFVRHWFHGAMLRVESEKMSKSLGNIHTVEEILAMGYSAMALRLTLLSGHYRQPLNFTRNGLRASTRALRKLEKGVRLLLQKAGFRESDFPRFQEGPFSPPWGIFHQAWKELENDLNTPASLGALFGALQKWDPLRLAPEEVRDNLGGLGKLTYALGLTLFTGEREEVRVPEDMRNLAEKRWEAKNAKDWAKADALREQLKERGWHILDRKEGYELEPIRPDPG